MASMTFIFDTQIGERIAGKQEGPNMINEWSQLAKNDNLFTLWPYICKPVVMYHCYAYVCSVMRPSWVVSLWMVYRAQELHYILRLNDISRVCNTWWKLKIYLMPSGLTIVRRSPSYDYTLSVNTQTMHQFTYRIPELCIHYIWTSLCCL